MDTLSLILDVFGPLGGRRLLDVGCGPGALARALAARGAEVTGIDPNPDAIAAAAASVPTGRFATAAAGALPFPDAGFDGAVFLNSLHHIPDPHAALREAARVVRPDHPIVVVEPLADGTFFSALRPVEDETAVRLEAQEAVRAAVGSGAFASRRDVTFARSETFESVDAFLARVVAVDPARADAIRLRRPEIEAAFEAAAERDAAGLFLLVQPLRAQVLVAARTGKAAPGP
ncbi:class I SAM-dependent methyltransferase [Methylobacterium nigriterrae]|uniref:class I SAM-dependent methyltransferase n=1 Tax=Methylobacterium nigriterrae TaxID=3127512 RepID=UPI003013287B